MTVGLGFLEAMRKNNVKPDTETYTAIIGMFVYLHFFWLFFLCWLGFLEVMRKIVSKLIPRRTLRLFMFVCFYFIFVFDFLDAGPKVALW